MTYEFFENEVYSEVLERLGKDRTKIMEDFRIFVAVDEKHEFYREKQYEIMVSDAKYSGKPLNHFPLYSHAGDMAYVRDLARFCKEELWDKKITDETFENLFNYVFLNMFLQISAEILNYYRESEYNKYAIPFDFFIKNIRGYIGRQKYFFFFGELYDVKKLNNFEELVDYFANGIVDFFSNYHFYIFKNF